MKTEFKKESTTKPGRASWKFEFMGSELVSTATALLIDDVLIVSQW